MLEGHLSAADVGIRDDDVALPATPQHHALVLQPHPEHFLATTKEHQLRHAGLPGGPPGLALHDGAPSFQPNRLGGVQVAIQVGCSALGQEGQLAEGATQTARAELRIVLVGGEEREPRPRGAQFLHQLRLDAQPHVHGRLGVLQARLEPQGARGLKLQLIAAKLQGLHRALALLEADDTLQLPQGDAGQSLREQQGHGALADEAGARHASIDLQTLALQGQLPVGLGQIRLARLAPRPHAGGQEQLQRAVQAAHHVQAGEVLEVALGGIQPREAHLQPPLRPAADGAAHRSPHHLGLEGHAERKEGRAREDGLEDQRLAQLRRSQQLHCVRIAAGERRHRLRAEWGGRHAEAHVPGRHADEPRTQRADAQG
ncbi:hypothetical protein STIAU_4522, partial [Stigmatella aurantiaca DW4/3-1]